MWRGALENELHTEFLPVQRALKPASASIFYGANSVLPDRLTPYTHKANVYYLLLQWLHHLLVTTSHPSPLLLSFRSRKSDSEPR